jgi:hypothetical protein
MERCILREGPDRWCLEGTVLTLVETEPAEIHYALTCDRSWRAQRCTVHLDRPTATAQIDLGVDETGSWFRNGTRIDGSGGVPDVDLGFTPGTNTITIRRLALAPGEEARISVVWLRFPEFDAVVSGQVYTRIAEDRYRFESGDFTAILETDEHGVVTRYGDLWREIRE